MSSVIFYFTGTGNSLYIAKNLAKSLEIPVRSMVVECPAGQMGGAGTRVGFVFPSYYGNLPRMVRNFVGKIDIHPNTWIFAVVASGGVGQGSVAALEKLLTQKGLTLRYGRGLHTKEAFQIAGKKTRGNLDMSGFWSDCWSDGTIEKLYGLSENCRGPIIGAYYDYDENSNVTCVFGVESGKAGTADFEVIDIPKATYAVFACTGAMPDAIVDVWNRILREFFPQCEYKHAGTPDLEFNLDENIDSPDCRSEVWVPVVKRKIFRRELVKK